MDITTLLLLWTGALLAVGAYTDLRWREVPDWLNFAALAAGLGTRAVYSLVLHDWAYILIGLAGLVAALIIAYGMFYLGQWGGGDSKMLLAIGALLGLEFSLTSHGVAFFINVLIMGAAYGIVWSFVLALLHWHDFKAQLERMLRAPPVLWPLRIACVTGVVLVILSFGLPSQLQLSVALFGLALPLIGVLGIIIKAVEVGCMIRRVPPTVLTEGDWIVKDVVVDGKRITGPSDLGVSIPQIRKLVALAQKGKLRTVLLKEGIPFVPSFLLGFLLMLWVGNVLLYVLP